MKAQDFLRNGADLLEERGKQYDQPGGERSMGKTVRAFNAITGRDLTEPEGWLLLQVLKDVRQWQNPDKYHADSAEDCVSYAALKAESLLAADTIRAGLTPEAIKDAAFSHGGSIPFNAAYIAKERHQDAAYVDHHDDFGTPLPVDDGEWKRWHGGKCPVPESAKVDYRMRDYDEDLDGCEAGLLEWDHFGDGSDIIAYKIHKDT